MPQYLFGVLLIVLTMTAIVAVLLGFSVYVLGAEESLALTWGWKIYSPIEEGFTIKHPQSFTVNPHYMYEGLGRNSRIKGTSFSVSPSLTDGTNLSPQSMLSVERMPHVIECTADKFLYRPSAKKILEEEGVTYSFAAEREVNDGAAREERVYALAGSNPCTAIRYTIRASLIRTDDIVAVREFDQTRLMDTFDAMRRTFTSRH